MPHRTPRRRGIHRNTLTGALVAGSAAIAAVAPSLAIAAGSGGSFGSAPPTISGIQCVRECLAVDVAKPGATIRVTGTNLGSVRGVTFLGGNGPADDASGRVRALTPTSFEVRVPPRAKTGPLGVTAADGRGVTSVALIGVSDGAAQLAGPSAIDARTSAKKVFFGARRGAQLTYMLKGSNPSAVRVDVVSTRTNTIVSSFAKGIIAPGMPQTVEWKGMGPGGVQPEGRYEFRVVAGPSAQQAAKRGTGSPPGAARAGQFDFLRWQFPIRGAHDYGTSINRFGAGRSGHSHGGQDVLADCGLPLVAARGGVVKFSGYQGAAGNYIVIDTDESPIDIVYMHMIRPATPKRGDRVYTGEVIGHVGSTGSSTACHLHFEMWNGPWYDGGKPFDPLSNLKAWDRRS